MIDLLLFNANFSSISAMSWHKIMYMIDLLLFNANFSSISAMTCMPEPGYTSQLLWCFYVQWFEVTDVDIVIIRLKLSFHYFYLFAAI
jgi:hypothetical protein